MSGLFCWLPATEVTFHSVVLMNEWDLSPSEYPFPRGHAASCSMCLGCHGLRILGSASPANTETHSLPTHRYSPFRAASNQNWAPSVLVHGGRDPRVTFMSASVGEDQAKVSGISEFLRQGFYARCPSPVVLHLCTWLKGAPESTGHWR